MGKAIDHFEEKEFQSKATKVMQEYAEAGMEILVEVVFMGNWDGNTLGKAYKEYEVNILSYISRLTDKTPF